MDMIHMQKIVLFMYLIQMESVAIRVFLIRPELIILILDMVHQANVSMPGWIEKICNH